MSGLFSAWQKLGLGRDPKNPPSGGSGSMPFHTAPLVVGGTPFYAGAAATLNFQYGNQSVMAFVSYEASLTGSEWNGYYKSKDGPRVRTAYVSIAPPPVGDLRLRFQVGAFPANYGAPGPWGWGTFGPVIAVRGYGGTVSADYPLTPSSQLSLEYGIAGVPEVDEEFVRGTYTEWPVNGLSSVVNHLHAGISYKNQYFAKVHFAHADGRNMRNYLDDEDTTPDIVEHDPDGRMDVLALELRTVKDPFGQFGVTPVYWNFKHATSVHDGISWGIDWTAGGREMTNNFLGPQSGGTGQIVAVSAEYNFSVSRILRYPESFDGNGRDLRVALALLPHWTLASNDPNFDKKASGYIVGADLEYVMSSWLSVTGNLRGQTRDAVTVDTSASFVAGKSTAYNATLGLILHSDWQSRDRMVLAYSRYFYSDFTDRNSEQPLDRNVLTLGASLAF